MSIISIKTIVHREGRCQMQSFKQLEPSILSEDFEFEDPHNHPEIITGHYTETIKDGRIVAFTWFADQPDKGDY